jgi:glycolate oxidase iron-sulfur subunit
MVEIPLELTQKCVKCALCKSVCPTYPYIQEEGGYARGRLVLAEMLLSGELKDEDAYKHLDQCAMCRRCEWVCPNGVEYKEIIATVRNTQEEILC